VQDAVRREAFDQARPVDATDVDIPAVTSSFNDEDDEDDEDDEGDSGYDKIMLGMTGTRRPPLQRRPTPHE
jgi:hypothetical protein